MNNFRKLLKKIDEIVSKTTVEDIENAINRIEKYDSLKESNLYQYSMTEVSEDNNIVLFDINYQSSLTKYNYMYNNNNKAVHVHMEGKFVA